jgi:hypothetical protein
VKDEKTPAITPHQARTILEIGEKRRVLLFRLKQAILDGDGSAEHAIARELVGLPPEPGANDTGPRRVPLTRT